MISGALRLPPAESSGARFTVLPRGGSPRSVQYSVRVAGSISRSIGSGNLSYTSSTSRRLTGVWPSGISTFARKIRPFSALSGPFYVHSDADAPFRRIRPRAGIALARVNEGLDVRAIEVGAHHAHPLPIAPVELLALLFDLELLGSEGRSLRNDRLEIPAVEIRTDDGAIVRRGISHVGPIEMSRRQVDHQPVGQLPVLLDEDRLEVGAVGIRGQHPAPRQVEEEDAAGGAVPGTLRACWSRHGSVLPAFSRSASVPRMTTFSSFASCSTEWLFASFTTPSTMACFSAGVTSGI